MGKLGKSAAGAGVLASTWQTIAQDGDASKAYPDELNSIEAYTKGKIKNGDYIDASNVELVKDLLEPIRYEHIMKHGRRLKMAKTTTDVMKLSPWEYIEATLANAGKAQFDDRGNVVTADGEPWIGGNPFPDAKTGEELFAAQTLSWGRHDASFYAIKISDVAVDGQTRFRYQGGWAELSTVSRVTMDPKPYWPAHKDKLRFQTVFLPSHVSSVVRRFSTYGITTNARFRSCTAMSPTFAAYASFPHHSGLSHCCRGRPCTCRTRGPQVTRCTPGGITRL